MPPGTLRHDQLQKASIFAMAAPTKLSGVEAPDVSPTTTSPEGGSHPVAVEAYKTIAFEIAADGSVSHLALMSASTPVAAEAARDAVRTAAPYPPPLFDMKACLIGGRAEVSVYSSGKCDEPRADRYLDAVAAGIQTAVVKKGVAAKYDGDVILRLDIARDGFLNSVVVQRADSDEAGAAVAAAARGLSRFEPPDELIQDCVAGNHLLIWIPLSEL